MDLQRFDLMGLTDLWYPRKILPMERHHRVSFLINEGNHSDFSIESESSNSSILLFHMTTIKPSVLFSTQRLVRYDLIGRLTVRVR